MALAGTQSGVSNVMTVTSVTVHDGEPCVETIEGHGRRLGFTLDAHTMLSS